MLLIDIGEQRYSAQWAGMPYPVYGGREGKDDMSDDINVRSRMINYLSGPSTSKTFKEAQSALTPLTFISLFPGMIAFMIGITTTPLIAIIPLSLIHI